MPKKPFTSFTILPQNSFIVLYISLAILFIPFIKPRIRSLPASRISSAFFLSVKPLTKSFIIPQTAFPIAIFILAVPSINANINCIPAFINFIRVSGSSSFFTIFVIIIGTFSTSNGIASISPSASASINSMAASIISSRLSTKVSAMVSIASTQAGISSGKLSTKLSTSASIISIPVSIINGKLSISPLTNPISILLPFSKMVGKFSIIPLERFSSICLPFSSKIGKLAIIPSWKFITKFPAVVINSGKITKIPLIKLVRICEPAWPNFSEFLFMPSKKFNINWAAISITCGALADISVNALDIIVPNELITPSNPPLSKEFCNSVTSPVAYSVTSFKGSWILSYILIPKYSNFDESSLSLPCKLSLIISAILAAAPVLLLIEPVNLSKSSWLAFATANIPDIASLPASISAYCAFSASVKPLKDSLNWTITSLNGNIFPFESFILRPNCWIAIAEFFVGLAKLLINDRKVVPAWDALIPELAIRPSATEVSSTL